MNTIDITFDIEANDLLNDRTVDYSASPYKLKPNFQMHCLVVEEHGGDIIAFYDGATYILDGRPYNESDGKWDYILTDYEPIEYIHRPLSAFPDYIKNANIKRVIAHNGINYDLLCCKLYWKMPYTVVPDMWHNKEVDIVDTMVLSKTLNADRFGGHSLEALGEKVGLHKIEFRKYIKDPQERFKQFAADMLYYCIRDVKVNTLVFQYLEKEKLDWDWEDAIKLEKQVAELITRQEHRGFKFDKELAESNILELDILLNDRRERVEPVLPPRPATQKLLGDYTPPARQFLKSGEPSSYLVNFVERLGGSFLEDRKVSLLGEIMDLPLPREPLVTTMPATLNDTTHIKEWLIRDFQWRPSEYKEKDLTVNSKKIKLSPEAFAVAVDKYVTQTLNSAFCQDRCELLEVSPRTLKKKLLDTKDGRPCKVPTNPNFTKGQEKELCPDLEHIAEDFPYARDVVEYLTYKHRRNSILGGGLEWEEGEEEAEKGYLAYVRSDGRIPTPSGTCDAATSRFKHRIVANIPRVTSLYGEKMRGLFGVDDQHFQIGYDFDSLEAKIEAHYVYKYPKGQEYGVSLTAEKPNDCHSVLARKISDLIGQDFPRGSAKSVKYGCSYNAQPKRVARTVGCDLQTGEVIFNAFWEQASPLKALKENMQSYWETTGQKKFLLGLDGRKLPIRSKGNVINTAFQSAGVIAAKRAMVIHDKKLKEAGLGVDFFLDDWKNEKFCQQLIAYHDESQLEVHKSLVTFKSFPLNQEELDKGEDEAKQEHKRVSGAAAAWKAAQEASTGLTLSDVGHTDKVYYVGYCKAGELAVQSVVEAGQYYNLNVDLSAGYMLGTSWASCH